MIRNILASLDGSLHSEAVRETAVHLAQKLGGRVTGLTVVDSRRLRLASWTDAIASLGLQPQTNARETLQKFQGERADAILESFKKSCQAEGFEVQTEKAEGIPSEVICERAAHHDLVVLGRLGEDANGKHHDAVGETTEAVIRSLHQPVLIVSETFHAPDKMVAAYDGSPHSAEALALAGELAERLQLPLVILNVDSQKERSDQLLQEAKSQLSPYKLELQLQAHSGEPAKVIAAYVQSDGPGSWVASGGFGDRHFKEYLLGSVSEFLLRRGRFPLLLKR
ncbi:MAG: universal stress protein [Planctomycetota bacterium]